MKKLTLFALVSLALANTVTAADEPVNPDEQGIFEFSELDVPEPPAAEKAKAPPQEEDPLAGLPETIRTVLDKLDRFGAYKQVELNKEIAAARKVAAEILVRNAVKADKSGRESLLEEAKRVELLDPDTPLIGAAAVPASQASVSLRQMVGSWQCQKWGRWTAILAPDGTLKRDQGAGGGTWRWIDEKRGVVLFMYPYGVDLIHIDRKSNPLKGIGIAGKDSFPIKKIAEAIVPDARKKNAALDPIVKLAAHEMAIRKDLDTLIQAKENKVAAWLLSRATELPAPQARTVVERASALERKQIVSANEPTERLKGIWSWSGKKLEFAPGGVVLVNKSKSGKWMWGRPNSSDVVVFILEVGDVVAYAQFSKSTEGLLRVITTKDKSEDAKKE